MEVVGSPRKVGVRLERKKKVGRQEKRVGESWRKEEKEGRRKVGK